jgi:hypothetical protein
LSLRLPIRAQTNDAAVCVGWNMIKSFKITNERKYILIFGISLLVLGAAYRFYPAVSDFFSPSEDIEFKKTSIEKYLRVVSERKEIEKKKNLLNRELGRLEEKLLTGSVPTLAAVEIQGMINSIAQANNVKVQTMQVLEAQDADDLGYVVIPVKFAIESNILQLKEIVYQIESPAKMLVIKELNVETSTRGGTGKILATLTVEGIMKGVLKGGDSSKKKDKKNKKN